MKSEGEGQIFFSLIYKMRITCLGMDGIKDKQNVGSILEKLR